jgi:hypothetical protein
MKLRLATLGCSVQVCLLIDKMLSVSSNVHVMSPSVFIINFSWTHSGIWSVIRFVFSCFEHPMHAPLNPSLGLGMLSLSQFIIGSSFRREKFSTSALVPRVFPRVRSSAPDCARFHSSPFRVWRQSSSAPGGSQPLGYHPTRNSVAFALPITPIFEGPRW